MNPRTMFPILLGCLVVSAPALAQGDCPPQLLLPDPDVEAGDFGSALAMHDRNLIIGDRHDSRMCPISRLCSNGMVYAYEKDAQSQVVPNPQACLSCFGAAVVLHGDTAIIQGGRGPMGGGGAMVYRFTGDEWVSLQIVESPDAPDTVAGFGYATGIDDERVVIGAEAETSVASNGGAAYAFRREPDGTLAFEQKLIAPDVLEGPRFGSAAAAKSD